MSFDLGDFLMRIVFFAVVLLAQSLAASISQAATISPFNRAEVQIRSNSSNPGAQEASDDTGALSGNQSASTSVQIDTQGIAEARADLRSGELGARIASEPVCGTNCDQSTLEAIASFGDVLTFFVPDDRFVNDLFELEWSVDVSGTSLSAQ